jgi:hypothetical protein
LTTIPALATHLERQDLGEGLGLTSLYNLSLGTTSRRTLYDWVEDRDEGPHRLPRQK